MTLTQLTRSMEQRKEAMLHEATLIPFSTTEQRLWMINCIHENLG